VIKAVRAELPQIESPVARRHESRIPYDSTKYISDALSEVTHTLLETLLIVIVVIFLFSWAHFVPCSFQWWPFPISLIGAAFLMLVFWIHVKPSDVAGDRAFGWSGGGSTRLLSSKT